MEILKSSKKEVWTCNYKGHEIKVENTAKATMYIDNKEVARDKSLITMIAVLESKLPDSDETVIAIIGGGVQVNCYIVAGQKLDVTHLMENVKTGETEILKD